MNNKICSFTGHRFISNISVVKEKLKNKLIELIGEGYTTFLNGGAIGFDTLCALTVIELKREYDISLDLILPCEDQDEKWTDSQKRIYRYILDNCDSCMYITKEYENGCMQQRNRLLCERCDLMISYLTKPFGGTYYTVNYAKKLNKKIIDIND